MVERGRGHGSRGTAETTRKTPGLYHHALMQSLAFNTSISFRQGLGFIWNSVTVSYYGTGEMGEVRWEEQKEREKEDDQAEAFKAKWQSNGCNFCHTPRAHQLQGHIRIKNMFLLCLLNQNCLDFSSQVSSVQESGGQKEENHAGKHMHYVHMHCNNLFILTFFSILEYPCKYKRQVPFIMLFCLFYVYIEIVTLYLHANKYFGY